MRRQKMRTLLGLALAALVSLAPAVRAEEPAPPAGCAALTDSLREHDRMLGQELRQIKHELAEMRQSIENPGMREVFAGIGYILGLFGAAAFVAARRARREG